MPFILPLIQAERTNKQERLHPREAKKKTQTQRMVLKHGGVTDESGRDYCNFRAF